MMIPQFEGIDFVDEKNPVLAVKQLKGYISRLETRLFQLFTSLESENMLKLNLDDLTLYTERGTEVSGDRIKIVSPTGEAFEVGYDKEKKKFVFSMPRIESLTVGSISAETIYRGGKEL